MSDPAFPIPLSIDQLALVGKLCAIQGQIENLFQETTIDLLRVTDSTACAIMGSTSIRTNSDVWIKFAREKLQDQALIAVADAIHASIAHLAQGRNDFVHAVFKIMSRGKTPASRGHPSVPIIMQVAIRTKTKKERAITELAAVCDEAARISRMLAHIDYRLKGGKPPSPWLGKF